MSLRRVRVNWTGSTVVGPSITTFYFDLITGTAAQITSAVGNFLTTTDTLRATTCLWATDNTVDQLAANGTLEGTTGVTPSSGVGGNGFDALPLTTQARMNLSTGVVVGTRLLQGRLYLPGSVESSNATGRPVAATMTAYNTALASLISDANSNWIVWSRTHATIAPVSAAAMWSEWGSLRSRRD